MMQKEMNAPVALGVSVGENVGEVVGDEVVGEIEGDCVGVSVGDNVGEAVGKVRQYASDFVSIVMTPMVLTAPPVSIVPKFRNKSE
jgi:hypothetical protein